MAAPAQQPVHQPPSYESLSAAIAPPTLPTMLASSQAAALPTMQPQQLATSTAVFVPDVVLLPADDTAMTQSISNDTVSLPPRSQFNPQSGDVTSQPAVVDLNALSPGLCDITYHITLFIIACLSVCLSVCLLWGSTIAKALRYGPCVTRGSHSFTCHPHTNHNCLYSPAARCHRPLAGTHCTYPQCDDQAELTWVAGCIPR